VASAQKHRTQDAAKRTSKYSHFESLSIIIHAETQHSPLSLVGHLFEQDEPATKDPIYYADGYRSQRYPNDKVESTMAVVIALGSVLHLLFRWCFRLLCLFRIGALAFTVVGLEERSCLVSTFRRLFGGGFCMAGFSPARDFLDRAGILRRGLSPQYLPLAASLLLAL